MKTWMLSIALLTSAAGAARADQCEWIDAATARKAQQLLASHPKVISFCEPCGEKAPGLPQVASTVELGTPQDGYKDVRINGSPVDLAYTYVRTSDARYQNLALLAGCPAEDVSPSLKVADETTNGVLIVADSAPVPAVTEPPAPPPPSSPALQAVPPHVFVFSTHTRDALPWLTIVLAGIASFTMSLAGILAFAKLRRRRAMKPRATNLPLS